MIVKSSSITHSNTSTVGHIARVLHIQIHLQQAMQLEYYTFKDIYSRPCIYTSSFLFSRSIGCTIIEMLTTKPPFSQFEPMTALYNIGAGRIGPEIPKTISRKLRKLLNKCFERDPYFRPSACDLLRHSFFKTKATLLTVSSVDRKQD